MLTQLNAKLLEERQAREVAEEKVIAAIKQTMTEFSNEITKGRREREDEEERIADLLEVTIGKLNQASQI